MPNSVKRPASSAPLRSGRLFRQTVIWLPTPLGWLALLVLVLAPLLVWAWAGERVLGSTKRIGADVLVVEGWIGSEGAREAASEFRQQGYKYVVATGGLTGESWSDRRWSHAEVAEHALLAAGIPRESVLLAPSGNISRHRTRGAALAVKNALAERGIRPQAIHVFTRTVHARRSQLIFSRVFADICPVGRVAWAPPGFTEDPNWWHYSYRAEDLLKESVGFVVEWITGVLPAG